jgi:RND family efflux transporter MFP subunit
VVRRGALLAQLSAPELFAQRAEADAKASADRATYQRLREAAKTKGAVAENELELAQDTLKADSERVSSLKTLEGYLTVTAPFDGIVTERDVHPGALVGPPSPSGRVPIMKIEDNSHLRLTVPVPEADAGSIRIGTTATFMVSAWPGERFSGTIARISHSVDERTRTMPVELDVNNRDGKLAPGMFAEVRWPMHRDAPTLFVPASAVVESMEKIYVDLVRDKHIRRVTVKRGRTEGDLVEVFGDLQEGDLVAVRGSEELAEGMRVSPRFGAPAAASATN